MRRQLDFIQALRGIAALAIVIYHARWYLADTQYWEQIQRYGVWLGAGVDLFFIISGFIMVYATQNSKPTVEYVKDFGIKRFSKIWPAYAVITVTYIFLGRDGFNYVAGNLSNIISSLLFFPISAADPLYVGTADIVLPVGWSLNYEAYFYLIFAISIFFQKWRWIALTSWLLLTLVALPATKSIYTLNPMTPMGFTSSYISMIANPIIWEFFAGILCGLIYLSRFKIKSLAILYSMVAGSICFYVWGQINMLGKQPGILGWGGYALLIFFSLMMLSKVKDIKPPQVMIWLGNMSFTLYLAHLLGFNLAIRLYSAVGLQEQIHTWTFAILAVISAVLLSAIIRNFLEYYLYNACKGLLRGGRDHKGKDVPLR